MRVSEKLIPMESEESKHGGSGFQLLPERLSGFSLRRPYDGVMDYIKSQTPGTKLQTNVKFSPCGILPLAGSLETKFHKAGIR